MGNPLFATKAIDTLMKEAADTGEHSLKRALGPVNLVTLGIGAIIGAGIFVLTGSAASLYAGPAIMLSYVLAGIGCVFAGLCYAEFASLIPIAGSAYTYGYATLGEIVAWIIGWDLILEYAFGAATVASGWSSTLVAFLQDYGINLPPPRGHDDFDRGNQRIGQLQYRHRICEAHCGLDLHRRRGALRSQARATCSCQLGGVLAGEHGGVRLVWVVRRLTRRWRRVFCLYWFRCCFHSRARSAQAAKGHARGYPWIAGRMHGPLHHCFRTIDRDGTLLAPEHWRASFAGHA